MSTSSKGSFSAFLSQVTLLIAGITKNVAVKSGLLLDGVNVLQPAILAQLATIVALYTAASDAQTAAKLKVAARKAGEAQAKQFVQQLVAAIKAQFGSRSPLLSSFGIALSKTKAPRTAEEKAISAALNRNTRKVRNTLGPKARQKVTAGGQPGITVTSPTGEPLPGAKAPVPPSGQAAPTGPTANGATPAPAAGSNGSNGVSGH